MTDDGGVLDQSNVREASKLKKVEKVYQGGKSAKNIKKSKVRNLDFLIRGGEVTFSFFPKCKCRL